MADIELVIKIPESQYKTLNAKTQEDVIDVIDDKLLIDAIKSGVPLPKGHGDLKDVNDLYNHVNGGDWNGGGFSKEYVYCNDIASAPTIIEADKAESEGMHET